MTTKRLLFCTLTVWLGFAALAQAQQSGIPDTGQAFRANFAGPVPGTYWFSGSGVPEGGLGYEDSFITVGGFVPVFYEAWAYDNIWNGMWYVDSRLHASEDGNFFANLGVGRRMFFDPLFTAGISVWYDVDDDQPDEGLGKMFHQVGVSARIVGNGGWQASVNGYFPLGDQDEEVGFNGTNFVGNNLLIQRGINSALEGVDGEFGVPVPGLEEWAGIWHIGGYSYESDLVDQFGGFRTRFEVSPHPNVSFHVQLNEDDQFGTTGFMSVILHAGGSRRQTAQDALLQPIERNAHIVRVYQEPIFATNPDNGGALWNAIFVDNSAPAGGTGTVESPFSTLAAADAAATSPYDIIFVDSGTGTSVGYDTTFTLGANQLLLGDGVTHFIPTQLGLTGFSLGDDGVLPIITSSGGSAVSLVGDSTTVSGFQIVGSQGAGIVGTGQAGTTLNRLSILNGSSDGIRLTNFTGDVDIADSTISGNTTGIETSNNGGTSVNINISGSTIQTNNAGISISADGGGTSVLAVVAGNPEISSNDTVGVIASATGGSALTIAIRDNENISFNGVSTGTGTGVILTSNDSFFNANVIRNNILNNAGDVQNPIVSAAAGVYGFFTGNSQTDVNISDNNVNGGGSVLPNSSGAAIRLEYGTTNAVLQTAMVNNNVVIGTDGGAFDLVAEANSLVDYYAEGNRVENYNSIGFFAVTSGNAVVRMTMRDNDITGNTQAANDIVELFTLGNSQLIAIMEENNFSDSAGSGVTGSAFGFSELTIQATDNVISQSADYGFRIEADGAADVIALLSGNDITGHLGANEGFQAEILATATAAASACIQLTNNVASDGFGLSNNAVGAAFLLEDNGGNINSIFNLGTEPIFNVPAGTCAAAVTPLPGVFP